MEIIIVIAIIIVAFFFLKTGKKRSTKQANSEIEVKLDITTENIIDEPQGKPIRFNYKKIDSKTFTFDATGTNMMEASDYWRNHKILSLYENDEEGAKKDEKRLIQKEKDYYAGLDYYKEKYGDPVNKPIKEVVKNLKKIMNLDSYEDEIVDSMYGIHMIIGSIGYDINYLEKWFNGGKWEITTDEGIKTETQIGWLKEFRKDTCKSEKIISDNNLYEFFVFDYDYSLNNNLGTAKKIFEERKRIIRKDFLEPFKKNKYNNEDKSWDDFDINHIFLQIRSLMMTDAGNLPQWIWNLLSGNPFDRVYRNCRDYMKWKGTKRTAKIVFSNVCKWESGNIFREGEEVQQEEKPLWINWNVIGKDLLSLKTKLKKENKGGLEWLKDEVGPYIKERASYYKQFGDESEYSIKEELLNKFELL